MVVVRGREGMHSTHVYQGLDVVIFSVLKRAWSDEHDKFEKSGPVVSKLNFLSVYARAHAHAFTTANILAAFSKTGIVTVSPSPQSKEDENDKLHELRRYARDFQHQHTTDAKRFNWDSDDEDYGLAIGRLVVT
jgi:hypothetical protein